MPNRRRTAGRAPSTPLRRRSPARVRPPCRAQAGSPKQPERSRRRRPGDDRPGAVRRYRHGQAHRIFVVVAQPELIGSTVAVTVPGAIASMPSLIRAISAASGVRSSTSSISSRITSAPRCRSHPAGGGPLLPACQTCAGNRGALPVPGRCEHGQQHVQNRGDRPRLQRRVSDVLCPEPRQPGISRRCTSRYRRRRGGR